MTLLDADAFCVAWALQKTKPWHPLLVCSHRNLLYIFDAKTQKFVGCLRGHGGVSRLQTLSSILVLNSAGNHFHHCPPRSASHLLLNIQRLHSKNIRPNAPPSARACERPLAAIQRAK